MEIPAVPVNVGDYYYDDGTWSTTRDNSKNVVGVVFSKSDATGSDSMLRTEHSNCNHGLVVCTVEIASSIWGGNYKFQDSRNNDGMYYYFRDQYQGVNYTTTAINGYTSTKALAAYRSANGGNCCEIVTVLENSSLPHVSAKSSGWYVPSYMEMQLMSASETLSKVNATLSKVGQQIGTGDYWTSSFVYAPDGNYDDCYAKPFDVNVGGWDSMSNSTSNGTKPYPVRVVLAF